MYTIVYNQNGTITISRNDEIIVTGGNIFKVLEQLRRFSKTEVAKADAAK